jgi:hypothetical protein
LKFEVSLSPPLKINGRKRGKEKRNKNVALKTKVKLNKSPVVVYCKDKELQWDSPIPLQDTEKDA